VNSYIRPQELPTCQRTTSLKDESDREIHNINLHSL
jgi:hypothetical protein